MSRRSSGAASADARPHGPSRRTLIAVTTAMPLLATHIEQDECVLVSERFLALEAKHKHLSALWSKLEVRLAQDHNFFELSEAEQNALPGARQLERLGNDIDQNFDAQRALLHSLPRLTAVSAQGLIGKLTVAAIEVRPEENAPANLLIASILRDLKAISGRA